MSDSDEGTYVVVALLVTAVLSGFVTYWLREASGRPGWGWDVDENRGEGRSRSDGGPYLTDGDGDGNGNGNGD